MNIGKFSVRNPVLINILMIVVLVMGIGTVRQLPQEQFPAIPFYFVFISVPYPGVSAGDVERTVTTKIEQEMQNLEQLDEMFSYTRDGISIVQLQFEEGISQEEFETLFQDVRTRFSNVQLPDDVGDEIIDDFSSTDFSPVIQINLYGDLSYRDLDRSAQLVSDRIELIPGVDSVTKIGEREQEIIVEARRTDLEARRISIEQIANAIRSNNISVPGGTLTSRSREYLLRTDQLVGSVADLERVTLQSSAGGLVYVGDIAEVREEYDEDGGYARYNGYPSIALSVSKIPKANAVEIVAEIRNIIEETASVLPAELQHSYLNDTSLEIQRNIQVLGRNIIFGFILVIVVLFFFLGFRNSLLTALGIPVSFAATFIILRITGETLNENVLFALVLVLGLLVDHAIVITENCYRMHLAGRPLHEAAIKGVNQVLRPVVAATATTVAAFLPLTFLPGVIGRFLQVVPITVSIALAASTLEALIILPSHFADWVPKRGLKARNERRFERFREFFGRLLATLYRHRAISVIVFVCVLVATFALLGLLSQDLFVGAEISYFYIDIFTPIGTPLSKTDAVVAQFEERLLPLLSEDDVVSLRASSGFLSGENENLERSDVGQILIDIKDQHQGRERSLNEYVQLARERTADIAGIERVRFRTEEGGPPTDPPVVFRLYGDSYPELTAVSEAIQDRLVNFEQLVDIRDNLQEGSPQLSIQVNEDIATRYGLTTRQVGTFIRNSFEGVEAGVLFGENEEIDIIVRYATPAINSPEELLSLRIQNSTGQQIPLSSLVIIRTGQAIDQIVRNNGKREITVQADATNTENLFLVTQDIEELFYGQLQLQYPDISLKSGGQFTQFANLFSDILLVLGAGILLIYTILGAQFNSYLQPLIILLSIPFSFMGVILYLIITGTAASLIVIYAAVALAGIAVNDSIVLISFINQQRKEGLSIQEAVIAGAKTRLRPIILTSLTTIMGLMPLSLGLGGRSIVWEPMANTIIFGLVFSTITTLVIVPCIYGLILERHHALKSSKNGAGRRVGKKLTLQS